MKLMIRELRNVSNYETETSEPDLAMIVRLADIFGVSLDELFGREGSMLETDKLEGLDRLLVKKIRELSDEQKAALLSFLKGFV